MRQQINLVNLELLPPKPFFQFRSMVISLAVIALALSLLVLFFHSRLALYQSTAELVQQRVSVKQERIKVIEQQVAQRQKNPQVVADLLKAQEEQQRLRQIAASLQQGGMLDESRSYATYLYALAQKPANGVWLTQIEFHGSRLLLEGMALHATDLPPYLAQLKELPVFAGQRFVSFDLGRKTFATTAGVPAAEVLMFRLEPVVEGKGKP